MIFWHIFSVLILLGKGVPSWARSPSLSSMGTQGWRAPVDCVKASDLCNQSPRCSSRYRIMRQCLVGKERAAMLANRDCQAALEVLQDSPLYDCRCRRGMKKELQCLQNYWSIHLGLAEEEEFYETSPYEPVTARHSDMFRLASIISGMDPGKGGHCSDMGRPCNPCLDAAKACNLNDTCKKQRSSYIATCNRGAPLQAAAAPAEPCSRKRCHKALRQFFDRVPAEFSYRLLFCSCRDQACAERRRQTIVPSCAFEDRARPSCLELRRSCRSDPLCRSRLADFHMNCQSTPYSITSCPNDNYQACLMSYVGLIGSEVTPNYMDASFSNITITLWCTCKGSGNHGEECEAFLRDFRDNACLRNAIQAFGYGPDVLPKASSLPARPTASAGLAPASTGKPPGNPPGNHPGNANEVSLSSDPCVFSTCANLKSDQGGHVESPFESRDSSKMEAEERERSSGVHLSSVQAGLVHLSFLWIRLAL
ncbi:GDNF family receptor alpha-2-like [Anguilla rostrata]|uniref:GDNF family receptor alpha-2-like n=1 Tax=Anguilla rostrata TaxID=7938 RepID=UPI0030CDFDF9